MRNKSRLTVFLISVRFATALIVLFATPLFLTGADFKGAAEVLREAAQSAPKAKETAKDPYAPFREKVKLFQTQSTNLAPVTAATQWLALVDEFAKISGETLEPIRRPTAPPLRFDDVIKALPPPAAWPELEKAVEARSSSSTKANEKSNLGLRLIAHTLTRNTNKRAEDLKALDALSKKETGPASGYEFASIFHTLNESILATMEDPEAILRMLESQLRSSPSEVSQPLQVPNLVALVGADKAESFFRKAFKTSRPLQIEVGTPTHKLATKIATEMVEQMPQPQWALVNSLDSVELYEALDKKFNQAKQDAAAAAPANTEFFGVKEPAGYNRGDQEAKLYYFLGLIARDRVNDAITIAKTFDRRNGVYFPPDVIKQMERAGLARQLDNFFAALLKENPESPFWGEYVRVAAHAGHTAEALNLVRATSQNKELTRERRAELKSLLPAALLANDDVEAGIAELRQALTNKEAGPLAFRYSYSSSLGSPSLAIAKIGKLLGRTDWLDEGIAAAKSKVEEADVSEMSYRDNPQIELAELLSSLKRGPEAEEILLQALRTAIAKSKPSPGGFGRYSFQDSQGPRPILQELVKVYHDAGRFEDVVQVLDQAEHWGAKDLAALNPYFRYSYGRHAGVETPIAFYAASALARVGKKNEASTILNHLLEQQPGLDRLYELLLDMENTNAMGRLDQLFARDAFEERPLIWKAHWLRTHGKLEEAEAMARKAISIDPSDGEQGPGDRMRAYAELADIRAARGNNKEANFLRGAVTAIRESETADRYHEAGLLKRAVKMYEDSLKHFADAYCIQSRLAVQLADLGMHEQAEEHYRRAYELMPESFGRVESHCFGCERAFDGERAQGIAEKVFTRLAQKIPNKPQVHYLLGYLREEEERPKEALDHYRQAVKLDPDYLNAWHRISTLGTKVVVPAAERDAVVFNLIRLDPHQRHGGYNLATVTDLSGLWTRIAEANVGATPPPMALYPLAASKAKLEQDSKAATTENDFEMAEQMFFQPEHEGPLTPAKAVAQNGFIHAGIELVSNSLKEFE